MIDDLIDPRTEEQVLHDNNTALQRRNFAADAKMRSAFDVLEKVPRGRMSENLFVTKYLKFFSPVPLPKEEVDLAVNYLSKRLNTVCTVDTLRTNLINEWLRDAVGENGVPFNTPSHPVDVIGESGEVLFTVPPLMVSKPLDSKLSSDIVMLSLMASSIFENDRMRGDAIVAQKIKPLIPKPTIDKATVEGWNKIYARYGLPQYVEGVGFQLPDSESKDNKKSDNYDDVFGFDD